MCLANLYGDEIIGDGRPAVATLDPAQTESGKLGLQMDVSAEQRAFQRWRRGAFQEVERDFARTWRTELSGIDLNAIHARYRPIVLAANPRPRDLAGIKRLAEQLRLDPRPLGVNANREPVRVAGHEDHERSVVEELNSISRIENPRGQRLRLRDDDAAFLKIERLIPVRKGKWRILPERLERKAP